MISVNLIKDRPDGALLKTDSHSVTDPQPGVRNLSALGSSRAFRLYSCCCFATSVLAAAGGIVSIALIETSDHSSAAKTATCIAGGLLILSSYYCCTISAAATLVGKQIASTESGIDFDPV